MSPRGIRNIVALIGFLVVLAVAGAASGAANEPLAVVPFEVVSSRVVIPVSVDGSPPLNFVFDNASGGTILHSAVAEALGLGGAAQVVVAGATGVSGDAVQIVDGQVVMGGAEAVPGDAVQIIDGQIVMGDAAVIQTESDSTAAPMIVRMDAGAMQVAGGDSGQVVQVVAGGDGVVMGGPPAVADIALGELTLDGVELGVLPLSHITMPSGEPIDGIIGYDILKQYVVEVDYDDGVLRVFDRDGYVPSDRAAPHEVAFLLGNVAQPCVVGEITLPEGGVVSGMFVLDAGAGADVVLNSPFVREHDLVSRLGASDAGSVAGVTPVESPVAKSVLPSFTFCGFSLSDVPVTLNQGTTGFLAGEGYAGVIGNRVLSHYNIAYDYAGAVVYLETVAGR